MSAVGVRRAYDGRRLLGEKFAGTPNCRALRRQEVLKRIEIGDCDESCEGRCGPTEPGPL